MISILMPVYNAAPFLEACLESIIAQSYTNWELLAVNDFSTDKSSSILDAFAKKDNRIKRLTNKQKGIIPALRLAFEHSSGDYITRMDADDLMAADKLEKLWKQLISMPKGSLSTSLIQYFADGRLMDGYKRYESWLNQIALEGRQYEEIYRECVIPSPCWMIRRSDLLACGAFASDTYPEDYDLVFRFYREKYQIGLVSAVLHLWRDHSQRSSRTMEQYAQQEYFVLKLPYFLQLDRDKKRPLFLWGAGKKGKKIAQMLIEAEQEFRWLCDNKAKIGLHIYQKLMEPYQTLAQIDRPQVLVLVSNPEEQLKIKNYFAQLGLKAGEDYFFFV